MMYRRPTTLHLVPRQSDHTDCEQGSEMAEKLGFAQTRFIKACPIDDGGMRSPQPCHQCSFIPESTALSERNIRVVRPRLSAGLSVRLNFGCSLNIIRRKNYFQQVGYPLNVGESCSCTIHWQRQDLLLKVIGQNCCSNRAFLGWIFRFQCNLYKSNWKSPNREYLGSKHLWLFPK